MRFELFTLFDIIVFFVGCAFFKLFWGISGVVCVLFVLCCVFLWFCCLRFARFGFATRCTSTVSLPRWRKHVFLVFEDCHISRFGDFVGGATKASGVAVEGEQQKLANKKTRVKVCFGYSGCSL